LYAYYNSSGNSDYISFNNIERLQITGTGQADTIDQGGYDSVSVDGGAGTDTITYADLSSITTALTIDNSGTGIFTQDNGTTIKNVERFSNLTTGFGNDTIAFTGRFAERVYTGDGDDTIALGLGNNDYADGGEGDDLLTINYSSNTFTGSSNYTAGITSGFSYYNGGWNGSLSAYYNSSGNSDYINFNNIERLEITGTGQADTIYRGGYDSVSVDGGAGTDTITYADLSSITSDLTIDNSGTGIFTQANGTTIENVERFSELTTGFGSDTIAFTGRFNENVYTGDGDDTIALGLGNNDYADGGEGDDLLTINYSSNTFTGSSNYTAGITSETYWWNPSSGYFRAFYDSDGNSDSISFDGIERLSITGTSANDAIQTGNGDDLLTGVNPNSTTPGRSEVDTLTGGLGSDRFILGDVNWVGYDDGNTSSAGTTDYALITDFTVDDVIQLKGASGNYSLAISGSDTHLYLDKPGAEPDELIAVLQNSPTTWHQNPTNNHFYKIIEVGSWQDAENAAIAENAHLVSINDQSEQEWLNQTFGTGEYYWIGLTDQQTEGLWEWTSGEPLNYTNWAENEPNNNGGGENYAVMNWGVNGAWNDLGLEWSSIRKAIIESNEVQQPDLSLTDSYFSYVSNLPTVTVTLSSASVNEDGTPNLVYTFTRTGSTANSLPVSYDITGTAVSSDYTGATPGTGKSITFAAGSSTSTLMIDPTSDTTVEGNETVIVTLSPSTNYDVGSEKSFNGTIMDD